MVEYDSSGGIRDMLKRKAGTEPKTTENISGRVNVICRGDMHVVILPVGEVDRAKMKQYLDMIFRAPDLPAETKKTG